MMHYWAGALSFIALIVSVVGIIAAANELNDAPCLAPPPTFTLPAWLLATSLTGTIAVLFAWFAWCARRGSAAAWLWAVFSLAFIVYVLPMLIVGTDLLLRQQTGEPCSSFLYVWSVVTLVIEYVAIATSLLWLPAFIRLETDIARRLGDALSGDEPDAPPSTSLVSQFIDDTVASRTATRRRQQHQRRSSPSASFEDGYDE